MSTRAGWYVRQPTGYRAFIPSPLPPVPPFNWVFEREQKKDVGEDLLETTHASANSLIAGFQKPEILVEITG